MQGSLITNGVVIQAVDKASGAFTAIGRSFNQMRSEFSMGLREIPRQTEEAFRPFQGFRHLMRTELAAGFKEGSHTLEEGFQHFNMTVRKHVNTFNSIIMGGVAVAMSGLGIRRAGQFVTGMIGSWVDSAAEFEKVMRQVKFLGQVSADEYRALTDRIIDIGVALPTSSLKVAEGTLDALRLGFGAAEAEYMAEPIAMMEFFAEGALSTADAAQFLNAIIRQVNVTAEDSTEILDMLMSTARYTAFTIDELWTAWQSARAAPGGLALEGVEDLPAFLTMLGAARTALTPRYAGRIINSFVRAIYQAAGSPGERGEMWSLLGIDLDTMRDPIEILETIAEKSRELWGDASKRRIQLQSMLGIEAMPIIDAYDAWAKRADESLHEMRQNIADSKGFAEEYMDELLYTFWGVRELLTGTIDTLKQLLGELFFPLLVPAFQYAQRFFSTLIELVRAQPAFARFIGITVALGGAFAVVLGTLMLFGGQLFSIYGSLMNVTIQLAALRIQSEQAFGAMATQSLTVGGLLRSQVQGPLMYIRSLLFRLTMISTFLYFAWRYDFLRVRSVIEGFYSRFTNVIENVRQRFENLGGATIHELARMDLQSENFWRRLVGYLTIATILWNGFTEALQHFRQHGIFALNQEMMAMLTGLTPAELALRDKIDPNEFPLLRVLTTALELVKALHALWDGFIEGLQAGYGIIEAAILDPLQAVFGSLVENMRLFDFDEDRDRYIPNYDAWENFGRMLGGILSVIVAVKVALFAWKWTFGGIFGIAKKLKGTLGGVGAFFTKPKYNIPRVSEAGWAGGIRPRGMHHAAGIQRGLGIPGMERLLGRPVYSHATGTYVGREGGMLPRFLARRLTDQPGIAGALERIPGIRQLGGLAGRIPGAKTLAGMVGRVGLGRLLGPAAMGTAALGADPGRRVHAATAAGVGFGGATIGAKAGAALGTAILPGIGTVAGAIIGGLAGAIAVSPFGEIIGALFQDMFNWLKENIFSWENVSNLYENLRIWMTEIMPERLGAWLGHWLAVIAKWTWEFITVTVPEWAGELWESVKTGFWNIVTNLYDWLTDDGEFRVIYAFQQIVTGVRDFLVGRVEAIVKDLSTAWSNFWGGFGEAWGRVWGGGHAEGGIITKPHVGMVGEDGPESIIPLSRKYRNRAVQLWEETGDRLGSPGAVTKPQTRTYQASPKPTVQDNSMHVNFSDGAIVIKVENMENPQDIRKNAKTLLDEVKKLLEKEEMRNYMSARKV